MTASPAPLPPGAPEGNALGLHLHQCLPCAYAMRWSDMCTDGKTLYDDMLAARYAARKENPR